MVDQKDLFTTLSLPIQETSVTVNLLSELEITIL